MKIKRLLCSTALLLATVGGPASANITYTFSGVTFDDGGSLTGSFTTNDAITSLVDYNFTSSAGSVLAGFDYTPALVPDSSSTSLPGILVLETASLNPLLQVTFDNLTATGSLITIGQFDSFEQGGPNLTHRQITAGEVIAGTPTGVPEPLTLSLFGAGLAGAAALRARRRKI